MDQVVGLEVKDDFTFDQERIRDADVVVFHVPELSWAEFDDTPKYPGQLWVAWSMESNKNYPKLADASFLRHFDIFDEL